MGSRGPKPTSQATLRLRGSWRAGSKKPNKKAVRSALEKPHLPQYTRPHMMRGLPKAAQRQWKKVVPLLEEIGLIAEIDFLILDLYARAYAEWIALQDAVNDLGTDGWILTARNGSEYVHPLLKLRDKAEARLHVCMDLLGLTPKSRLRLQVKPAEAKPVDGKARFFDRPFSGHPPRKA